MFERKGVEENRNVLWTLNISEFSELYRKTIQTIYPNVHNEPIGESLFELVRAGYEFATYGGDDSGYKHILWKNIECL